MPRTIKRGDTYPFLRLVVSEDGFPIDLTAADTIKVIMKTELGAALVFTADTYDAVNGGIEYEWLSGDTDTSGEYNLEVEIEWAAGGFQTVPNSGYDLLTIEDDLGGTA